MNLYYETRIYRRVEMAKNQKIINLDYEFIEKEDTQNMIQKIKQLEHNGNHGFRNLMGSTNLIIQGLMTILMSIILTRKVFISEIRINGINNMSINIIFMLALVAINMISFIALAKSNVNLSKFVVSYSNKIFRLDAAYDFLSIDYKSGKDVRIYGKRLFHSHREKVSV